MNVCASQPTTVHLFRVSGSGCRNHNAGFGLTVVVTLTAGLVITLALTVVMTKAKTKAMTVVMPVAVSVVRCDGDSP